MRTVAEPEPGLMSREWPALPDGLPAGSVWFRGGGTQWFISKGEKPCGRRRGGGDDAYRLRAAGLNQTARNRSIDV
jgi:hypothetical protein